MPIVAVTHCLARRTVAGALPSSPSPLSASLSFPSASLVPSPLLRSPLPCPHLPLPRLRPSPSPPRLSYPLPRHSSLVCPSPFAARRSSLTVSLTARCSPLFTPRRSPLPCPCPPLPRPCGTHCISVVNVYYACNTVYRK
jgi:hypothetical protein